MDGRGARIWPILAILVAMASLGINPVRFVRSGARTVRVLGLFRGEESMIRSKGLEVVRIADTTYCEDLHMHEASGLLFTACEGTTAVRHKWFPPLAIFDDASVAEHSTGSIVTINPETMESKRLRMDGFSGPFGTHGIDILDDPSPKPGDKAVFVFAVNHRPKKAYYGKTEGKKTKTSTKEKGKGEVNKSDSVVEIFHHVIGTDSIQHVRTVKHELIATPNDVVALSPTSFLVTNDHHYRQGRMRTVEDLYYGATWSTVIWAQFDPAAGKSTLRSRDGEQEDVAGRGVLASVALSGLQNNNGIGRGLTADQVVVVSAIGGTVYFGQLQGGNSKGPGRDGGGDGQGQVTVKVRDKFEADSTLDNPSYFVDPYANETFDASGFVLAGLSRGGYLHGGMRDVEGREGVMVWQLRRRFRGAERVASEEVEAGTGGETVDHGKNMGGDDGAARLLFRDNGEYIRTASAAVLVALDPAKTDGGRRQAWLFVTGFMSKNVIAVKIEL